MAIIEPPTESEHLSQGDILQGVRLHATKGSWHDGGGKPVEIPRRLCLVLSRSCVARHKSQIVVAGIKKYEDQPPREANTFKRVREFLLDMRDGTRSPDRFYLGQVPGEKGRFCAQLDELFSIEVPSDPTELMTFLNTRRVGRLNGDFTRDLNLRVFVAFASLGFSDEGWLSDDDLNWLVETGQGQLREAEAELQKAVAEKTGRVAHGTQYDEKKIPGLEKKGVLLQRQVEPYIKEKQSRDERSDAER